MKSNFKIPFSLFALIFLFFIFIFIPFCIQKDPLHVNLLKVCSVPDSVNILGTDEVGRDLFARILYGGRATFFIGLFSTFVSCLIGVIIGSIAGYFGGKVDMLITQIIDISLAFPSLLLAIGISIILQAGWGAVIIALSLTGWAGFARIIRSQVLILKNEDYVIAAKALGANSFSILGMHILPNCRNLIIVTTTMKMGSFMLAESGLSFLGLGVPAPYPTLGGMISSGRDYLFSAPWITLFPGILIAIIVLLSNKLGENLSDLLNIKQK